MHPDQASVSSGSPPSELRQLLAKIKLDIAYVIKEKQRVEQLALYYQDKVASQAKENSQQQLPDLPTGEQHQDATQRPAKRRRSSQSQTEILARIQAELDTFKARATSLSKENRSLEQKIQSRDRTIAEDAKELDRLRQDSLQIHDLQIRLKAAEADVKAAEMRSQRHTMESQVRFSMGEENIRFLNSEIARLSEELTKARFAADTATASHAASIRSVNERNKQVSEQLAEAKGQIIRTEDFLRKLETENATLKSASERDKKDYEEEKERLNRIIQLQKDLTKEAEQRVRDYEEIVTTLKEEIGAQEKESVHKGRLGTHAEVLLKNLQDALDSRMRLLHQQKEEMERARASEMALFAREETLVRETEDARWEAEQAKKETARMRNQMKDQARKIVHLEKQIEINKSDEQHETLRRLSDSHRSPQRSFGFAGSEIAPPIDTTILINTPDTLQEVDAAVQELSNIRRRHHQLMATMRERRSAYS